MKQLYSHITRFTQKHFQLLLFIVTTIISVSAIIYFMLNGLQNLANYDALGRINIARKITDSLTPGVGQLGGVWLPFPQILMVPFMPFDIFWKTGLAGAIISGAVFVLGAIYIQKATYLLTKSIKASILVWFMFVANINILLLQTMAMSEVFFMTFLIMILYYLTKWVQSHTLVDFLAAAFFVFIITLTRYEGYFVLIGATLAVLFECIRVYRKESWQKVEGMVLLFLTVAGFGVFLWCIYSFLFYNDFFNWLHLYSDGKSQVSLATKSLVADKAFIVQENSLAGAFHIYTQVIMWMNGKITTFLGLLGFVIIFYEMVRRMLQRKTVETYMPLIITSIVLFIFLVYGYQKGFIPQIDLPRNGDTSLLISNSNIRYGLILAPCILLLAGFAAAKHRVLYFLAIILVGLQLGANIYKPQSLQYSLPLLWQYSVVTHVAPFMEQYTHGLILISANEHENFIFQTGLPYKNFIYEGSRDYWVKSLNNPALYAEWVIYDERTRGDNLEVLFTKKARAILQQKFKLVYDVNGFKIWHKR